MKKKLLPLIAAAAVCLSAMAACSAPADTKPADSPEQTSSAAAATEAPTEAPSDSPAAAEVGTQAPVTEAAAETETPEAGTQGAAENPGYTVTDMDGVKYATTTVNIRTLPGTDGDKAGSLSYAQEVRVTGAVDNGWFRIAFNDSDAFVSGDYLSDTKPAPPVTPQPAPAPQPAQPQQPAYDPQPQQPADPAQGGGGEQLDPEWQAGFDYTPGAGINGEAHSSGGFKAN